MKLINLLFLLLPLTGFSQVTIDTKFTEVYYTDSLPTKIITEFEYGNNKYILHSKGWRKDSIIKVDDIVRVDVDSFIFGDIKIIGNKVYNWKRPEPKLYKLPELDTLPSGGTTTQSLQYYNGSMWSYSNSTTEVVKGKVETPVNIMDSGIKVETVETKDTIYKCPVDYTINFFAYDGSIQSQKKLDSRCTVEKVITTRRYKLYIINEYAQKEYLSMELTKTK